MLSITKVLVVSSAVLVLASGCGGEKPAATDVAATDAASGFAWPASLTVVGDGYPAAGAPCRRIGESAATIDYLDDSAALVGCPNRKDAENLGGRIVREIDGVTLVSVPNSRTQSSDDGGGDALVPGTSYNATAKISCAGYQGAAAGMCDAGVKRGGKNGTTVEVTLADGRKRVIFFNPDGSFLSFATAEADGTAAMKISSARKGDITVARLGNETYEIPDALVLGG